MPWKRISPLIIAGIALVAVAIATVVAVVHSHKPSNMDAVVSVDVTGNKARVRTVSAAPAATIPDATALGNAVLIDSLLYNKAGLVVHFKLDPTKLPSGELDCATPTANTNMAIAVFNQNVRTWIPLATTCAGNELRTTAPHTGMFRAWLVPDGSHQYQWMFKGEPFTTHVTTTASTPVAAYLSMVANGVSTTFFNDLLAQFDSSPAACTPASTKYSVSVKGGAGYHKGVIASCAAGVNGTNQLKIRNGSGIPLAFGPQDAMRYVRAGSQSTNTDVFTLMERTAGYARGTVVVPAHASMPFAITNNTPATVNVKAQVDLTSAMLDLATVVLGVWNPQFQATDTVMQQLLAAVSQRLAVIVDMDGTDTIKAVDVQATIRSAVQSNNAWTDYQTNALKTVDLATCLHTANASVASLTSTTFGCLTHIFTPDGTELQGLLGQMSDSAQHLQIKPEISAQFKALTGATDTQISLSKAFNPAEVYQPFIGDWRAQDTNLHLYSDRTGRMDIELGLCAYNVPNPPDCWQHLSVSVKVNRDGITITFGDSDVTDSQDGNGRHYPNSYAAGFNGRGDGYKLTLLNDELIQLTGTNARSKQNQNAEKMCGHQAAPADRHACNI